MGDREEDVRLSRLYSEMSDGELEKVAADSASLTDIARNTLANEMQRRAVHVDSPDDEENSEIEFRSLTTICKFRDLPEALLAKGSLDSAGIESFLADDNMVRMDWLISNLLGGIKLLVKSEDAEVAKLILDQPIPEDFAVDGVGEYKSPRCPHCDSLDVGFDELNKPIAYGSLLIGFPLPISDKGWKCHTCGRKWDDQDSGENPDF